MFTIACCTLFSCNPKITKAVPYPDVEGEGVVDEDLSVELSPKDSLPKVNSVILAKSLHGLELIEENWDQTILYSDTTVQFLLAQPTSGNTIVAIAATPFDSGDNDSDFYFYELDMKGVVLSKTQLYGSNYSCNLHHNLREFDNAIHYFRKADSKQEWVYDLAAKTHKLADVLLLDWETITDWKKQQWYPKPDKSQMIHMEATNLTLITGENKVKLISQPYDGAWSFGMGCWNEDGDTFFFDNSGAVACIWKIDLTAKTLAKIIPEHEAKSPAVIEHNGKLKLLYCEESFIKISSSK